jgi:hypothetical protein
MKPMLVTQRARSAIAAHKALQDNADHNEDDADRQQARRVGKIGPGILVHRRKNLALGAIITA